MRNKSEIVGLFVFASFMVAAPSGAHQPLRPQTAAEISAYIAPASQVAYNIKYRVNEVDEMVKVLGARVAWADYSALRRDFNNLRQLDDAAIDTWIVDNFAYISRGQIQLNGIRNTPIPTEEKVRTGFRPEGWGRAALLPQLSDAEGMVDVKGAGHSSRSESAKRQVFNFQRLGSDRAVASQMRIKDHSDGLLSLGEAIAETSRQQAAQKLFDIHNVKTGSNLQTVESYFIVELPFGILKDDERSIPAALYGRQAHIGRDNYFPVPRDIYTDYFGSLQQDRFGAAVDFGGVHIRASGLADRFGMFGGEDFNAQKSKPWAWAHSVAEAVTRKENPDHDAINRHLREMLEPIEEEWRSVDKTKTNSINAQADVLLAKLRQWRLTEPAWYAELNSLLESARPTELGFVQYLVAGRRMSPEEIAAMRGILTDPQAAPAARRGAARFFSMGGHVLPWNTPALMAKKFRPLPEKERRLLAPFLPMQDKNSQKDLFSGLADRDPLIRRGAAIKLAEMIEAGTYSGQDKERLARLLSKAIQDEPLPPARRLIYRAIRELGRNAPVRQDILVRLAADDSSHSIRNSAVADLLADFPHLSRKQDELLLQAFDREPDAVNRIALGQLLIREQPEDPLFHWKILQAEEGAEGTQRAGFISLLEGKKVVHPEAKKILNRLAMSVDEDVAQKAQQLGGRSRQTCGAGFQALRD